MNHIVVIGEYNAERPIIVKIPITLTRFKQRFFAGYPTDSSVISRNITNRMELLNDLQTYTHLKIVQSYYELDLLEERNIQIQVDPEPKIEIFQTPYQSGKFSPIVHSFVTNRDNTQTDLFKFYYPSTFYKDMASTLPNKVLGYMQYDTSTILRVQSQLETRYQKVTS